MSTKKSKRSKSTLHFVANRLTSVAGTPIANARDLSVAQQKALIHYEPVFFPHICQPFGMLDDSLEAHALFYYALCARQTYERHKEDLQLVGDVDTSDMPHQTDYLQLFTSIATMYKVQPEAMAKCWDMIDAQFRISGLPKLPNTPHLRHNIIQSVPVPIN